MRRAAAVGFLCAVVSVPGPNQRALGAAPSFDCGRATAPIERLICSSDALSGLDDALSAAFRASREGQSEDARTASLKDQRRWLQSRLASCDIPAQGDLAADRKPAAEHCLADLYQARIAALQSSPKDTAAVPPSGSPAATPPAAVKPIAAGGVKLDKTLFAARGTNETIATVADFGRYSIMVKSDQGTALQLVDRMAGPGVVDGSAGHGDGRVDTFLDRGQYKVRLMSDPRGSGDAELSVMPFAELNPEPQQLVELKPVAAELGDHEQRSWWLDIKERRFVAFEAAGRYLADLHLWKDGNWLVDATATAGERDPAGGEPLAIRQLALWLEPGLYRLTAYGGPGEKWSSGATGKPLYVNCGIPRLPEAGRAYHEASSLGVDRWIVPQAATYFRIDIDTPEHTTLSVAPYDPERPYATGGSRAAIEKNSRDPTAEVSTGDMSANHDWLVTVERKPGARYRLQYFDDRRARQLTIDAPSADYWLAALQAGDGADALDPTAIVVRANRDVIAAAAVEVDPAKPWRRTFNLLDVVTLFLHADQPTEIAVGGTGADAEYRVEPFMTARPRDYRTPPTKRSGGTWSIERGYSVLTILPREGGKGVLDLTLRPTGATGDAVEGPRLAAPVFPKLGLDRAQPYMLYLSATGQRFGASVHRLPLDLADGASFQLAGGARLTMPVTLPADGKLEARTEDGKDVPLAIGDAAAAAGPMVGAGEHRLAITAPAGAPAYLSLLFTPAAQLKDATLPAVDPARLAERPRFPVLAPGKPQFLDLQRDQKATFAVAVDTPALYRLESTGIIETEGTIRTRTIPALDQQAANGIGRNFLIQQYLREGDYQLSAHASGQSFGAIGVGVTATPVAELGALEPGLWARATLSPGSAGRYRFHIAEAGDYRLHTMGLGHDFAMRLDDADGWPLVKPGSTADVTLRLEPGDYQMVLLPQPVESRAVTLLGRIVQPPALSGHGPFALGLGDAARNRWMEPEKGAPRTPDRWNFTLPAEAEVTVTVDNGMQATLVQGGKPTDHVALSERPWVGTLPAGDYAVDMVSAAPNSRVDYTVQVSTTELLAGQKRTVEAPARLPVSIGADRQVEFASFGGEDVRARLYDSDGKLVAANDDRENDWNFLIPVRLAAGRYALQVDPVGTEKATTEVTLAQPDEVQDAPLPFGKTATFSDGKVHVLPLPDTPKDQALILTAHSSVSVGLTIEVAEDQHWRTLESASGVAPYVALPVSYQKLRARVWATDHGEQPVEIAVSAVQVAERSEDELTGRGVTLSALDGAASGLVAARIKLKRPGILQLVSGAETVQWGHILFGRSNCYTIDSPAGKGAGCSTSVYETVERDGSGTIVTQALTLFLIDRAGAIQPIVARHVNLEGSEPVHVVIHGPERIAAPLAPIKASSDLVLWQVDGQGGQPGANFPVMGVQGAWPIMAVGPESPTAGSAVTVVPRPLPEPWIQFWNAGTKDGPDMPITVHRTVFHAPKLQPVGPGIIDGALDDQDAKLLLLPKGFKRLALALPVGAVAVAQTDEDVEQMVWISSATTTTIETDADNLLLLYPSKLAAPYSLTITPIAEPTLSLAPGRVFSRYNATAGVTRLYVSWGQGGSDTLHLAGAARDSTFVGMAGNVRRGPTIAGKGLEAGYLDVAHGVGLMAVSIDESPHSGQPKTAPRTVAAPSDVALSGPSMSLRLEAGPARLIHLTSDSPVIINAAGSDPARAGLFQAGADLNFVTTAGKPTDFEIDPAGVPALSGTLHLAATPLTPIGEGLGPKRRLAPGESRAFSFTLPQDRTVGVGVRASVDIADCRLLAADGTELGRGLVHMHELKAGTYVLVVDAPSDGPAIEVEPALVGTELPDRGPPDSVKASYLALVGKQSKP